MKLKALIIAALSVATAFAQEEEGSIHKKGNMAIGLNFDVNTMKLNKTETPIFGVGATFGINTSERIRIAPTFDYMLYRYDVAETSKGGQWNAGVNVDYLIVSGRRCDFYSLMGAGAQYTWLTSEYLSIGCGWVSTVETGIDTNKGITPYACAGLGFDFRIDDHFAVSLNSKYIFHFDGYRDWIKAPRHACGIGIGFKYGW